jgi:hypothetical protein
LYCHWSSSTFGESRTSIKPGAIHLQRWLKIADVEDGVKPGVTQAGAVELREAKKRIKLLEQEVEVLRRAAAYLSQASLPK